MLVFNRKDALQGRYVRRITRRTLTPPVHWLPRGHTLSSKPPRPAWLGHGPGPDGGRYYLRAGTLVELMAGKPVDVRCTGSTGG